MGHGGRGRYDIDPATGVAKNCSGLNGELHQSYGVDLRPLQAKCCTPNVDCAACRLYAPALTTLLFRQRDFMGSAPVFDGWLSMCEQWGRIFLPDGEA